MGGQEILTCLASETGRGLP